MHALDPIQVSQQATGRSGDMERQALLPKIDNSL